MARWETASCANYGPVYPFITEDTVKERSCWSVRVSVFPWNQLNQDFKIRYILTLIELGKDSLMPHLRILTVC